METILKVKSVRILNNINHYQQCCPNNIVASYFQKVIYINIFFAVLHQHLVFHSSYNGLKFHELHVIEELLCLDNSISICLLNKFIDLFNIFLLIHGILNKLCYNPYAQKCSKVGRYSFFIPE